MLPQPYLLGITVKIDFTLALISTQASRRFLTTKYETKPVATTPAIMPPMSHQLVGGWIGSASVGVGVGGGGTITVNCPRLPSMLTV